MEVGDNSSSSLAERLQSRHAAADGSTTSNGDGLGPTKTANGTPRVNLADLPTLPRASSRPATTSAGNGWGTANLAAKTLNTRRSERVSLPTPTSPAEAVREVQRLTGVSIEASKGVPGYTTFLIRGSPEKITTAKASLADRLSPKIARTVVVPASARAAILGPKGSTLHEITDETQTKIHLGSSHKQGAWDLDVIDVKVEGREHGVESAIGRLLATVGEVRASLSLKNYQQPFAGELPLGSVVKGKLVLTGDWPTVRAEISKINDAVNDWDKDFQRLPVENELVKFVPPLIAWDSTHAVVIPEEGVVFGPPASLAAAKAAVDKYVKSLTHAVVDLTRAHNRNEAHANLLGRLFSSTKFAQKLSSDFSVRVQTPEPYLFEFLGQEDAVGKARKALVERVNLLSPIAIEVIPKLGSPYLSKQALSKLPADGDIKAIVVDHDLVLYYDSPVVDFPPTAGEISERLASTRSQLAPVEVEAANIVTKTLPEAKALQNLQGPAKSMWPPSDVVVDYTNKTLNGPTKNVEKALEQAAEALKVSKDYVELASYTTEFSFDPQHVRQLIGKSGQQISKLRDEYDVRIDVDDNGLVKLRGIEANVKRAQKHIFNLQERLRDLTTSEVDIPLEYHSLLIGPGGKSVNRVSEKYDTQITFPHTKDSTIIKLRGPSKGVNAVKREFRDVVDYEKSQSHSQEFHVSPELLPRVIGKQGGQVASFKALSNANDIDVGHDGTIRATGTEKAVNEAKKLIENYVRDLEDQKEIEIDVDTKYHRLLTGLNNAVRDEITRAAGGGTLAVPPSRVQSTKIRISGPSEVVAKIEERVKDIVKQEEDQERYEATLDVPSDRHKLLVGSQGSTRRATEVKFGVRISIPARNEDGPIYIRGPTEKSVDEAKEYLAKIAATDIVTVKVPSFADVRDYCTSNVHAQPQGRRPSPPKEPSSIEPASEGASWGWKVENTSSTRTWQLSCDDPKALEELTTKLQKIEPQVDGWLWISPKPGVFARLVGPGGSTVNGIRRKTGATITIPKNSKSESIHIQGTAAQVESAKAELVELVEQI